MHHNAHAPYQETAGLVTGHAILGSLGRLGGRGGRTRRGTKG
jgi:hypothetical protein